MTCPYSLESTQKQQDPARARTPCYCWPLPATGVSLEWPLGHMDPTSVSRGPSSPSPWLLPLPRGRGLWRGPPEEIIMTQGTLVASRTSPALWGQRGVQWCWPLSPPVSVHVIGDLLVACAAGRRAPALRLQADHAQERSKPWKGSTCALVLLVAHRAPELRWPWRPCLSYNSKWAMSCSVAQRPTAWHSWHLNSQTPEP